MTDTDTAAEKPSPWFKERHFDIVVWGASSFVGRLVCHYLVHELKDPNLVWAMAGRSEIKLLDVKDKLGRESWQVPHLLAYIDQYNSLKRMCKKTKLIISTVGPYALYGDNLVRACVETGTDYCDLSGEPQWIRKMIDFYQLPASQAGARIVNSCGFDSIPSDMGVWALQRAARERHGELCKRIRMGVKTLQGGYSGGTIASMANLYREASKDKQLRSQLNDPYYLCPESNGNTMPQPNVEVEYDPDFKSWAAPFVMAAINTKIVLRSNALTYPLPDQQFQYDEVLLTGDGEDGQQRARKTARSSKWMALALAIAPLRWLALKFFLPKPGEGPSPEEQEQGSFELQFIGTTAHGHTLKATVTGDRDPGYGSTAKMLTQAAICLVRDISKEELPGGFWTPAVAFDGRLVDRLEKHAGVTIRVE
ncbi:MAG: hypothetical protein RLZZ385_1430 [Pseudomonadota bacterium]